MLAWVHFAYHNPETGSFRVFRGCIRESRETRGTSVQAQQTGGVPLFTSLSRRPQWMKADVTARRTGQETAVFTGFRDERIKRAAT